MSDSEKTLPRDEFSVTLRGLVDNPGAVRTQSRVDIADFYGRSQTWLIDTFRVGAQTTTLVQRMSAEDPLRLVLPPQVMAAVGRQDGTLTRHTRRRGARQAVETKRAEGKPVGNPEALRRARKGTQPVPTLTVSPGAQREIDRIAEELIPRRSKGGKKR